MFSKFNNMQISNELLELAKIGVDDESLNNFSYKFNENERNAIQYTLDWNGRCIVLHNDILSSRTISLASISLRNTIKPVFPLVMLVKAQNYTQWAKLAAQYWPDKKISVFSNPKGLHNNTYSSEISTTPDWSADIFITSYSSLIWYDAMQFIKPKQLLIDEIENDQSINYRWAAAVHGLFYEIRSCLILIHIQQPGFHSSIPVKTTSQFIADNPYFLNSIITDYLWAISSSSSESFAGLNALLKFNSDKRLPEYLTRKYQNIDYVSMLPLFGVNTDLII
jgi:hypothetical protein